MRKRMVCMAVAVMMMTAAGCGKEIVPLEKTTIATYEKNMYEVTTVMQGDILPELNLQLNPVEKMNVTYFAPQDEMEVKEVHVAVGDFVNEGDPLVSFKSGDSEEKIEGYQEELEMQKLLIEHYEQLMLADPELEYEDDIEQLKSDMQITMMYIAEENAKLDSYTIRAEKFGVVYQVSELMSHSKVGRSDKLVSIVYNSGEYYATVEDEYPFVIGEVYQAVSLSSAVDMEIVSIEELTKGGRKVFFMAKNPMEVARANYLRINIEKTMLSGSIYVDEKAVLEVNGKYYVFYLSEDGFREGVEVEIGDRVENYIVIKSGVKPGDKVVINS